MVSWSVHSRVQTRHDCVPFVCVQGARMVRELFEMARSKKACIIFFDEIDAVGGNYSGLHYNHIREIKIIAKHVPNHSRQ